MTRLQELLAKIADEDDVGDDRMAAFDQLNDEATVEWLPELRAAFAAAPDFVVREALAGPLARLGGAKDLPLLLEGARRGEKEGHDNDSLQAAICDVVEADQAESFALLAKAAASGSPQQRKDAAWLLGFIDTPESFRLLEQLLRDSDPAVGAAAVPTIAGMKSGDGLGAITSLPLPLRQAYRKLIEQAFRENASLSPTPQSRESKAGGLKISTLVVWLLIVGAIVMLYLLSPGSGRGK